MISYLKFVNFLLFINIWAGLFNAGLRKPRRGGLAPNLNSHVKASFC